MPYLILGHLTVYAATWASIVLIDPRLGSTAMPWLFGFAFFGECFVMPLFEAEWRRTIRDALRARLMSRWAPFTGGAIGALFWIVATAITWAVCVPFNSLVAIGVAVVLTFLWIIAGVVGGIGVVSGLAMERLARRTL